LAGREEVSKAMSTEESISRITKPMPMRKPTPAHEELHFVARTSKARPQIQEQNGSSRSLSGITLIVALAGLVAVLFVLAKPKTNSALRTVFAESAAPLVTVNAAEPEALLQLPDGIRQRLIPPGTLSVTSLTEADIYVDDRFVGAAPAKLDLPAGTQRVEYRHLGMSKVVNHVIKSNETTAAMITFDIPVQINAKPWAHVSIDGPQRQTLGQTPLSVQVPIGSTLVFENPNFGIKTYQVTGRESEIRMSFP
jgi:hypothetical protein